MESIRAAVHAGADAVYAGGRLFGARAYADNPEKDALLEVIDYCHLYGVKLYLTVNTLLKEYETYKTAKKIKTPRLEALRLGFQKSYEAHDYATIVAIAKKIPSDVVETDEKLLRYFDRAQLHLED